MDALIVIDMQKGMFNKHIKVFDGNALIQKINDMIDRCHRYAIPVIFLRYTGEYVLTEHTENWEIISDLHYAEHDLVIDKFGSDAFRSEMFISALKKLNIRKVFVSGVFSHGCVQSTVMGALCNDYDVCLIEDAHSNVAKDAVHIIHAVNDRMKQMGVPLLSSNVFLESLDLTFEASPFKFEDFINN